MYHVQTCNVLDLNSALMVHFESVQTAQVRQGNAKGKEMTYEDYRAVVTKLIIASSANSLIISPRHLPYNEVLLLC